MGSRPLDRIHIRDLGVRCIVGVNAEERLNKQDVIINVTMYADLSKAGASDGIEDTVDYKSVKKELVAAVEASEYLLLERLAERVAEIALTPAQVLRADVCVDKPGALRFARSVAVEITRAKEM